MADENKSKKTESTEIECRYEMDSPCHFNIGDKEYSLYKGDVVKLPADNEFVKSLIAQNRLKKF